MSELLFDGMGIDWEGEGIYTLPRPTAHNWRELRRWQRVKSLEDLEQGMKTDSVHVQFVQEEDLWKGEDTNQ